MLERLGTGHRSMKRAGRSPTTPLSLATAQTRFVIFDGPNQHAGPGRSTRLLSAPATNVKEKQSNHNLVIGRDTRELICPVGALVLGPIDEEVGSSEFGDIPEYSGSCEWRSVIRGGSQQGIRCRPVLFSLREPP